MEFDWDDENIGHIARHGVEPSEVEEVFSRSQLQQPARTVKDEIRIKVQGTSAANRPLTVVYTKKSEKRLRPITAHTMNRKDRKLYAELLEDA